MSIAVKDLAGIYPAIITAIITPMKAGGDLDLAKLDRLIEDLIGTGVAGICACGTTGQNPVLTRKEHLMLVGPINRRISGRCQIIASAGSNFNGGSAQPLQCH